MNTCFLGRTGVRVSELGLGTMTFGKEADEAASRRMLDAYVAAGGNFIDTADMYNAGASEEILGRWLKGRPRDDLVLATKVFWPVTGKGPNDSGLSRKYLLRAAEASLRRLGVEHVDVYYVHMWDAATRLEDTLSALDSLVRAGKVRTLGASNYAGWQLQRALDLQRAMRWETLACLQAQYSLLCRSVEWELTPACDANGVGLVAWSPLKGGWLSGKYRRGMEAPPEGTRARLAPHKGGVSAWKIMNHEPTWSVLDALATVAQQSGKTVAQAALNWLLRKSVGGAAVVPVIGASSLEQLQENLGGAGWALTPEQVQALDDASRLAPLPYPYDYVASARKHRS